MDSKPQEVIFDNTYSADDSGQLDTSATQVPISDIDGPEVQTFTIPHGLATTDSIANRAGKVDNKAVNRTTQYEGYLYKYSPSLLKGWQKRYVVVKDNKLTYRKTKEQKYPNGVLNFDHFRANLFLNTKDQKQFQVKIEGLNRKFLFKTESKEICEQWQFALADQILESQGYIEQRSADGLRKPWRFDNMSEAQFKRIADTGDLLLFKSNQSAGKLLRSAMKMKFDHVAMILRFETDPDEVYLVDATGNQGVSLNKWSFLRDHIGKGKFYDKVVLRHIEFDRGDQMVDNLEKFLSQALGQKYKLFSANKLSRRQSIQQNNLGLDDKGEKRLISKDRTFFCSELVAKAFKILGILEDDDRSSARFYPGHFCSKYDSSLNLTPGTVIENELMVILDRQDLVNPEESEALPDD